MYHFRTVILEEADEFIAGLDKKIVKKLFFVIRFAEQQRDPKIFKKLRNDIWEFKVSFAKNQIRILAFWDKTDSTNTLVIATNGFYKKTQKTPLSHIDKATRIRTQYFLNKNHEEIFNERDGGSLFW